MGMLREYRDIAEKQAIMDAVNACQWNIAASAEVLGVSRVTLYNLMKKHQVIRVHRGCNRRNRETPTVEST